MPVHNPRYNVSQLHAMRGGKPDPESTTERLIVELEDDEGYFEWSKYNPDGSVGFPIIAEMSEADFNANTMTMRAKGHYYARAGKWLLIPLSDWYAPRPPEKPKYGFLARLFGAPPTENSP